MGELENLKELVVRLSKENEDLKRINSILHETYRGEIAVKEAEIKEVQNAIVESETLGKDSVNGNN